MICQTIGLSSCQDTRNNSKWFTKQYKINPAMFVVTLRGFYLRFYVASFVKGLFLYHFSGDNFIIQFNL